VTLYKQTKTLLLMVVAIVLQLKVMKQRCHFPSAWVSHFRPQEISQEQWRGCVVGLFPYVV